MSTATSGAWDEYTHNVVNHLMTYVDGNVHTNGIENFWSLLKRTIGGTYVSVEPFHLFRYVDEQAFRFNNRPTHERWRPLQLSGSQGHRQAPQVSRVDRQDG